MHQFQLVVLKGKLNNIETLALNTAIHTPAPTGHYQSKGKLINIETLALNTAIHTPAPIGHYQRVS